jgi:hypothetical protein
MMDQHPDLSADAQEVPRSFPAVFGALLAMAGIIYAEFLVSWATGIPTSANSTVLQQLVEILLLIAGGAICGHVTQFSGRGCRLRLLRIFVVVSLFDLGIAVVFSLLAG